MSIINVNHGGLRQQAEIADCDVREHLPFRCSFRWILYSAVFNLSCLWIKLSSLSTPSVL